MRNAAFSWGKPNGHMHFLYYHDRLAARLHQNNPKSYGLEIIRGDSFTFMANTLAKAKAKALSLVRKEIGSIRKEKEYQDSQPTPDKVNRLLSKSVIDRYGKAIKVEPVAFSTDKYRITFESGHTQETKIPKRNPHGFCIVDQHLNKIASGNDYDKLQDRVDRHNEEHDEKWFVIDESDYMELNKKGRRNPKASKYYYEDAPSGMTEHAIRAYNAVAKGMTSDEFYYGKNRHLVGDYDQYKETVKKHPFRLFRKASKRNPRKHVIYVVKWENGEQHFTDKKDAELYKRLLEGKGRTVTLTEKPRTAKNVSMGYFDASGFHPIRASHDYDEDLVDEHYRKRPVRKYAKKEKAFKSKRRNPTQRLYFARFYDNGDYWVIHRPTAKERDARVKEILAERKGDSNFHLVHKFVDTESYARAKSHETRNPVASNPRRKEYIVRWWSDDKNDNQFDMHQKDYDNEKEANAHFRRLKLHSKGLRFIGIWKLSHGGYIKEFIPHQYRNPNTASNPEMFNVDKLDKLSGIFQGHINGKQIKTVGSDWTPPLTARLGKLAYMKLKNGKETYEINFDANGDAWLSADARKNIYLEGKDARIANAAKPKRGSLIWLGEVQQINYRTNKSHIENGQLVEYYHELGEVDGVKPNAFLDHDGFILLNGGNYDIDVHGIEN